MPGNRTGPAWMETLRTGDAQVLTVLLTTALFVIIQFHVGARNVFASLLGNYVPSEWQGLLSWGWWAAWQSITGFFLPVTILLVIFRRKPSEIGLGAGRWRLAMVVLLLYLPLAWAGTFFLSAQSSFLALYPHYRTAAYRWDHLLYYESLYILYWIGWEYLWRGYLLFGLAHRWGAYAIVIQTLPFALLHAQKPFAEALLSIPGGLLLGVLVWQTRSFWVAVPIHAAQMFFLDVWSALRLQTGIRDTSLQAFFRLLHSLI